MLIKTLAACLLAVNMIAQSGSFLSGPVPTVKPKDIRIVATVTAPMRKNVGKGGVIGFDRRMFPGLDPDSNLMAIWLRTGVLLALIEKVEALAKWRKLDTIPDAAFAVVATYPITIQKEDTKFDVDGLVAALRNVKE